MRILFCGSRDVDENSQLGLLIWRTLLMINDEYGDIATIVHGNARGVDRTVDSWAKHLGLTVEAHDADWATHKKAAGPIRNREMLATGIDYVYAFTNKPLANSKGTADMVDIARRAGIPTFVTEA